MKKSLTKGWHVLYVKSRHEKKVYKQLLERGVNAYLPLVTRERKWSDRTKKVEMPLFQSYVFVNVQTAMDFHKALSICGACTYIRFGKECAIVKDEEIRQIKLLMRMEGIEDITVEDNVLKVGETKVITNGSLKGLECEVLQIKNKNIVTVRIGSLKQNLKAMVPTEYLTEFSKAV
jgi:transcription antitermination factor NusG